MSSGRIEPLGPLGPDGPGRALLVLDRATGMRVAGKRLTLPEGVPYDLVRREAMALGGPHQSINPVLEVVADGDAVWVLSQAIPGRSLRHEVRRLGALGPAAAAAIGLPVLAALSYAHGHGVVHGNLHPGNVLIATDNRIWVGDFGIPALGDQTVGRSPGYTAPDAPSPAADLWSLGAVLYTAAMGRAPFERDTPAATAEAVREGIRIEATDPFTSLLRDLLAADPSRRPDAATVHTVLQNVLQGPTGDVPTVAVGGTAVLPGGGAGPSDGTAVLPGGGAGPSDGTAVMPGGGAVPPGGTAVLPEGAAVPPGAAIPPGGVPTPPGGVPAPSGQTAPGNAPTGPVPGRPARGRMRRIRLQVLVPAMAGAAALGAAAALFVPPEVVARPFTDTSTVAAEPSASPSARVDLNVGPFTKTPNACKVIADSLVQELVPSAEDPSAYENDDYRSCTWRSAFQTPEAKRATLSVTLNRIAEQWLAESTFDLEKRVQRRLAQDVRDVPDLGHEAFSYVRAMRTPLRQYQVTYKFRLSNLQATIEYERSVSVDPDGSIQQGAEKTARAVLDALLKNPD
mgnify:CR=1 FL=1